MSRDDLKKIEHSDVVEYVSAASDFAFEMTVVEKLTRLGFACRHAGTYKDPLTQKARQFDIRASMESDSLQYFLVVECKNLRDTSPLLVHTTRRSVDEAYHEVIARRREGIVTSNTRRVDPSAFYPVSEPIGKQTDQITRRPNGGFASGDSPIFEKVSQALNGTFDVVSDTIRDGKVPSDSAVIPMLVVPDGRLWTVEYDRDGAVVAGPAEAGSTTLFLDHEWIVRWVFGPTSFRVSHLDIVCFGSLDRRIDELTQA